LVGCTYRRTDACGPRRAVYQVTNRYQRAPGAHKSYPLTLSSRLYLSTDVFFNNGRTTTGHSSIDSLQPFAHPPPLPPVSRLRFHRTAAVVKIQSVEEIENVRPGGRNRLHFERANTLFFVLRTDDCGPDLDAKGKGALPPGPPHPATRRPAGRRPSPSDPPTPPRGGRGGGGPPTWTPRRRASPPRHAAASPPHHTAADGTRRSRCAARGRVCVRADALALRCSP